MTFWLRFSFLSTLITPALIISSCTSLTQKADILDAKQESLLLAYEKAKSFETSDPMGSCSLYHRLASEEFPLNELALLRAHLICPSPETLGAVPANLIDRAPWLAGLDLDRLFSEALKKSDHRALAQASLKKALWSDQVREKVQLLQAALEYMKQVLNPIPEMSRSSEDLALQEDIQSRLFKLAPRLLPTPLPEDYFKVGSDLIYQRQFEKGRRYLELISKDPLFSLEEQYQARRALRNSFKIEQRKEQHVHEAEKFARWLEKRGSPQRVSEAYVTWARAAWTQGNTKEAKLALDRVEKKLKGKILLEEIYFVRAKMAEEAKDLDRSLELLNRGEKESRTHSAFRSRILFSKAWILRKQGKFTEAVEAFKKLKLESQDSFEKNKFTFWLARSQKQAGQMEPSLIELQELTQNDPLGYYGLLAYREMNTDLPALNLNISKAEGWAKPASVSSQDHALIRALTYVDESQVLEKYLDRQTLDLKNQQTSDPQRWLYFLKAYARAGLYNPLFQQLGGLPTELKNRLLSENPELLFPQKYLDIIRLAAEKFQVRAELILSIMRQESAFNPLARSPADALGLMQVIPSVAQDHESRTGIKLEHFEDLYQPEVNIPVGASVLSALSKKYRGQFLLTAAAYNANEKAIEGWLKTRLNEDPLEFIEDVPYEETRSYMKLVLRNFIFYSRLSQPGKSIAFPNWCLEDLQTFKKFDKVSAAPTDL